MVWLIRHTNATRKINKSNMNIKLCMQLNGQLKEDAREVWIVIFLLSITSQECMKAKLSHAFGFKIRERLEKLLSCHAKLSIIGISNNAILRLKHATRIKACAH